VVYDRRSDKITITREGASKGALDMFDVTDALIASVLDGLSGTHLLFGSLAVQTEPSGAVVSVNGKDVGPAPVSLRGLPVGAVKLSARSEGRENAESLVTIADGETADATLTLERSKGTLAVEIPDDAVVKVRNSEVGEKEISGASEAELPTGQYEAVAACPGLDPIPGRITVQRNDTQSWMPWTNAYLAVESQPSGAAVFVDGVERGSSPMLLELEPGSTHKVALKSEKFQEWTDELEFPPGRKQNVTAEMSPMPGSLMVQTALPGASIKLDEGDSFESPHLFEDVPAGLHTVTTADFLRTGRYYTSEGTREVEVRPEEQSIVYVPLTPGKATLTTAGVPQGCTITVDGMSIDAEKAAGDGVDIPAGVLDIEVTSASQQKWKARWAVPADAERKLYFSYMTPFIPHRTIKIDGKTDDWAGILPVLTPQSTVDVFPNQPGTQIKQVFTSRDVKNFYFRIDFADGTPTGNLSKDIDGGLKYQVRLWVKDNSIIIVDVSYDRSWGWWTNIGIWIDKTRTWKNMMLPPGQVIEYRIVNGSMEIAVPVAPYLEYLTEDGNAFTVNIASADRQGKDDKSASTEMRQIFFIP
jgi:hypothetical protein